MWDATLSNEEKDTVLADLRMMLRSESMGKIRILAESARLEKILEEARKRSI